MKKYIATIVVSLLSGIGLGYLLFHIPPSPVTKEVKIVQISGEKITHKDINYQGNSISFKTEADGKGVIKTEIPKENIPEAYAWMYKRNAVQANVYLHDGMRYGVSYWRRWNVIELGGGVIFNTQSIGFQSGVRYIW